MQCWIRTLTTLSNQSLQSATHSYIVRSSNVANVHCQAGAFTHWYLIDNCVRYSKWCLRMHLANTKTWRWEDTETRMVKALVRARSAELRRFREVAEGDLGNWHRLVPVSGTCQRIAEDLHAEMAAINSGDCWRRDRGPEHSPESKCCCTHEFHIAIWLLYTIV